MNITTILNSQFVNVALPIVITIFIASWLQNKRFDDLKADMNRRFDEVFRRLDSIESKLDNHTGRIIALEERTSPIGRRS
jgi:23S rRNA C2498 (ribose-2'-O)-methylase RlmM